MTDEHRFPDEVAWRDDGHVSDEVVTALADGQRDVVPLDAYAHVSSCAACGQRLGQAALFASLVDEALVPDACPAEIPATPAELAVARAHGVEQVAGDGLAPLAADELAAPWSGKRLPLPVPALIAALVLAALGAAPALLELAPKLPALVAAVLGKMPVLVHTLTVAFRTVLAGDGTTVTLAWTGAGLVLLMIGVLVTRLMPLGAEIEGDSHE